MVTLLRVGLMNPSDNNVPSSKCVALIAKQYTASIIGLIQHIMMTK